MGAIAGGLIAIKIKISRRVRRNYMKFSTAAKWDRDHLQTDRSRPGLLNWLPEEPLVRPPSTVDYDFNCKIKIQAILT